MTTFPVPTTGIYRTADGKEAVQLNAGALISLADAVRWQVPGAAFPPPDPPFAGDALQYIDRRTIEANKLPLRRYHRVLASVASTSVDIMVVGDSVTEGKVSNRTGRYTNQLLTRIRRNWQPAGVTGTEGYFPAYYVSSGIASPFAKTGTTVNQIDTGLGRRVTRVAPAATLTLAFTGTKVRLFYARRVGGGDFTVAIDGGSTTTLNGLAATDASGFFWDSAALTAGAHTLVITGVAGAAPIEGAFVYNGGETAGIHMWESGHSGYTTGDFLNSAAPMAQQNITNMGTDLVILNLGLNDYALGVPVAAFKANMVALVSQYRTIFANQPNVVVVVPFRRLATVSPVATWDEYVTALYQLVGEDGNLGLIDLNARFGPDASGTGLGLLDTDNVHPTDAGHSFIANAIAGYSEP